MGPNFTKRTSTPYGLASGDIASTYLWSKEVTDRIAETALITKNRPNGEKINLLSCWATYANNNYIPNIDYEDIGLTGKIIRVDQIPLVDLFHANLLLLRICCSLRRCTKSRKSNDHACRRKAASVVTVLKFKIATESDCRPTNVTSRVTNSHSLSCFGH